MEFDDQDIRAIDEGQSASSTNRITSIIAYLIGVETRFFGLENKTLDPDAIETLDEIAPRALFEIYVSYAPH